MRYSIQIECGQREQGSSWTGADLNALVDKETIKVVNGKLTAVLPDSDIVTVEDLDGVTLKLKDGKVTAEVPPAVGVASEWGVAPVTVMASTIQTVPFRRSYTNIPTVIISLSDPATLRFVGLREVTTTGFSFSSNYAFTNQSLHYVVYSND